MENLGVTRSSFYRWYDRWRDGGPEALRDRPSKPSRVWNRIPEAIQNQIVELALDAPELSPRELAVRFTDESKYFVSESSVYRLLKAHEGAYAEADRRGATRVYWVTEASNKRSLSLSMNASHGARPSFSFVAESV